MKEYDIWIGSYNLGQGYHSPTEPQKIATIKAETFEEACLTHEKRKLGKKIDLSEIVQSYNVETNYNRWTGKYFSTEQEALDSFETK